ncbi:transferrin-binding protein-like solute binding protein [Paracoccus saliphilus]|uniref:Transferrin-binding protein-like solute binding protein n=1 Tax=Paracoccus saliphilus TaxID=405559 RepID=A0AA45W3H9_9RHOB|nr:transferrin-binding protein-like solute binding protein [Paracoccus saliphilus]WCR02456.1 transferrin-binding protein-like solute binding protein [Paracoccus saliphilus]SIS75932.1 hypothetical protein SAMN05421772_10476 [Paracoccus saliphilus]
MKIYLTALSAIAASAILTGCGGSGGVMNTPKQNLSYNELYDSGIALIEKHKLDEDENDMVVPATPIKNMPSSGTATYAGVASFSVGDGVVVSDTKEVIDGVTHRVVEYKPNRLGQARLTANFGEGKLTGDITDFRAYRKNAAKPGKISYDGKIADNLTEGRFTGEVNIAGTMVKVDMPGDGGFAGPDADALVVTGENAHRASFASEKAFQKNFQEIVVIGEKK